jgi:hypothetical protein
MLEAASIMPAMEANTSTVTFGFSNPRDAAVTVSKSLELQSGVDNTTINFGQFGLVFDDQYVICNFVSKSSSTKTSADGDKKTFVFEALRSFSLDPGFPLADDTCYVMVSSRTGSVAEPILCKLATVEALPRYMYVQVL